MKKAKFMLENTVRVHTGASDVAYKTIFQEEDEFNNKGISKLNLFISVVFSYY